MRFFGPHFGYVFRHLVVMFRVFLSGPFLSLFLEGSWPAKRRPWPQLSLILGHFKTQKVSSRLREAHILICVFNCGLVLAALGLLLGLLLVLCSIPKCVPDPIHSRPGSVSKKGPKDFVTNSDLKITISKLYKLGVPTPMGNRTQPRCTDRGFASTIGLADSILDLAVSPTSSGTV